MIYQEYKKVCTRCKKQYTGNMYNNDSICTDCHIDIKKENKEKYLKSIREGKH
jgi:rRNA maturation endonuclease Nob1